MKVRILKATGRSKCRTCEDYIPKGADHLYIEKWPISFRVCQAHAIQLANEMLSSFAGAKNQPKTEGDRFNMLEVE